MKTLDASKEGVEKNLARPEGARSAVGALVDKLLEEGGDLLASSCQRIGWWRGGAREERRGGARLARPARRGAVAGGEA
ncbi:MAG: hypothetical protein QXI66_03630 [Pyrobaculum sp.]